MSTVTGQIKSNANWTQQLSTGVPETVAVAIQQNWQFSVTTSGTTADKADLKYTATLSLAGSAQTLDLTSLTDIFGASINFARVRSVAIRVKSTTDGQTLTIGNAASNAWTGFLGATSTLVVQASTATNDGWFVITAPNTTGMAVSGTSKSLKLDPGASTFTVDIEIVGCSA